MSLDADAIIDRKRLKRSLTLWRLIALIAILALGFTVLFRAGLLANSDHVAEISLTGLIIDEKARSDLLQKVADNEHAKALIISIDSPGGTTIGGEILYNDIRRVAKNKPVVGVISTLGTSAAYMAATATHHIIAGKSSLTGSIGVLVQTAQFTGLLEKLGVKAEAIRSAPLKSLPSPFEPMTDEVRATTQSIINDTHRWFVNLVAARRGLPEELIKHISDGRVFTGQQALEIGLIDGIGGKHEARNWLSKAHRISTSLPLLKVEPQTSRKTFIDRILGLVGKTTFSEQLTLDGLISLWQPQGPF